MKLYRFSPIQNEDQLRQSAAYVAEQITVLCDKAINRRLQITYLTIFAHYEHEFEHLTKLLPQLGEVHEANNGLKVVLNKPIGHEGQQIVDLRIRKPDPYRMQVGCGDFSVEDYGEFKRINVAAHLQNLRVIERPDYEMIEFYDPDYDVLAYIVGDYA